MHSKLQQTPAYVQHCMLNAKSLPPIGNIAMKAHRLSDMEIGKGFSVTQPDNVPG